MGVGKTATSKSLYQKLINSVWLDGDWCWMMNPFIANEENKEMVLDNISHLLRNFLMNSSIISSLIAKIALSNILTRSFS